MDRVYIWGTGLMAAQVCDLFDLEQTYRVIGFIDNAAEKWGGQFRGYEIKPPQTLIEITDYDAIIILCLAESAVIRQITGMGVSLSKVIKYSQIEIRNLMIKKARIVYRDDSDTYEPLQKEYLPDSLELVGDEKEHFDKFIVADTTCDKKLVAQQYNVLPESMEDIGFILKHLYYRLYLKQYTELGEEEKDCIRKLILTPNRLFFFDSESEYKDLEVYYDSTYRLRYVNFFGKRMYLSRSMNVFDAGNGRERIRNPWREQDKNSPHKYFKNYQVSGVVVDCGTCEGNFSLYNIDKISRLYLVESDPDWAEALEATFAAYKDKVVICNKSLGRKSDEKHITLDDLLGDEKPDFIKMDIEGSEPEALKGAEKILSGKDCVWNVCVYHKQNHAQDIQKCFDQYGYKTSFSEGYMNYLYDRELLKKAGLRKCLIEAV